MDLKRIIANNIYILRNKHNLTQEEFTNKLNINLTRGQVSHIEIGDSMPSAEFIKAVCLAFNVSADWILSCNVEAPEYYSLTNKDILAAIKFHNLDSNTQNAILNFIDELLKK